VVVGTFGLVEVFEDDGFEVCIRMFAGTVLSVSSEKVSGGSFFGDTEGRLHGYSFGKSEVKG